MKCCLAGLRTTTLWPWVILYVAAVFLCLVFLPYPFSDDDLGHFGMARDALEAPELLIDIWARPGFTLLYLVPAQFGFLVTRIFSALLTLATGLLVASLLKSEGRFAATLGFAFTVFQPYTFQLADGALTETVFAAAMAYGMRMRARGRLATSCLAFSWAAITRFEGLPLLLIFAVDLIVREKPWSGRGQKRALLSLALLGVFPFLWNCAGFVASGFTKPLWLLTENLFLNAPVKMYGSGSPFDFVLWSWAIHGPAVLVLALIGCKRLCSRRDFLVPAIITAFYLIHSALWATGTFRTGGYLRFFASIGPLVGFAAAMALPRVSAWLKSLTLSPARAMKLTALATAAWAFGATALHHLASDSAYSHVAGAVGHIRSNASPTLVLTTSLLAREMLGTSEGDRQFTAIPLDRASLEHAPEGTLILYAAHPNDPEVKVPIDHFYTEEALSDVAERRAAGKPYAHRLHETNSRFVKLAEFSIETRGLCPPDEEPWPYLVKVFRVQAPKHRAEIKHP